MNSRRDLIAQAINECMKELYENVYPKVTWKNFTRQCKKYSKKYSEWEKLPQPRPDVEEYCGLRPYEFYYIPHEIMKSICDHYVYIYKLNGKEEFESSIDTILNYCKEPIRDKYIEEGIDENGLKHSGYRGYEHFDSIITAFNNILTEHRGVDSIDIANELWEKVKEYCDEAKNFFNFNRELNDFNMNVYLGVSPNSNKEAVIENWKKYRNKDIEIDEEQIKKEYYREI